MIPQSPGAAPLNTRKIIKASSVSRNEAGPDAVPAAGPIRPSHGGIQVQFRQRGDLIEALDVQCTCGRRATLDCMYDTQALHAAEATNAGN